MVDIMIFDPMNRLCWTLAFFILFLCGAYFVIRGIKKEKLDEKLLMVGFGGLFIGQGIVRLIFYLSDFCIVGFYDDVTHIFYGNYENTVDPYFTLIQIGYLCNLISMAFFFFTFEKMIKKTKFILTILNIVFITVFFFTPFDSKRTVIYIFIFLDAFFLIMFLIWLSKISSIEFQAVSMLMMIGFILYLIGNILDSSAVKRIDFVSPTTPALFIILGSVVAVSPLIINPKYLSKSIVNWIIFASFIILMIAGGFNFIFNIEVDNILYPLIWITIIIGFAVLIFIISHIVRSLRPLELLEKIKPKEDKPDILQMFIKPQKLTEEEVTFHKEQKICLVCKGKVSRMIYVCPSCDALYCPKCSKALSDLDNCCWVCGAAIDETKPVKTPEKEVELKPLEPIKHKKDVKKMVDKK